MYAELPPPEPSAAWTGWRARWVARYPQLSPWLLRLARSERELRLYARYAREIAREVREDPEGGLRFWQAHQRQEAERLVLLAGLRARVGAADFELAEVSALFTRLALKKDDAGMAQWFGDASRKLSDALRRAEAADFPEPAYFQEALKELRFLGDMPAFYRRYELLDLELEVKTMYDALLARLDALTLVKKEQMTQGKEQHQLALIQAETERQKAEQAKLAEENARVRELKQKLELEKERAQQKKILLEAEAVQLRAEEDVARERAERERQAALQKDFARMQEEERLRTAIAQASTLDGQLDAITLALSAGRLNPADGVTGAKLAVLRALLEQKLSAA